MGVLTDFILATDADLPAISENGVGDTPFNAFPGIYGKGLTVEPELFYKLLTHCSFEEALKALNGYWVYESDNHELVIRRFPSELVEMLARLSESDRALFTERCFEEEPDHFRRISRPRPKVEAVSIGKNKLFVRRLLLFLPIAGRRVTSHPHVRANRQPLWGWEEDDLREFIDKLCDLARQAVIQSGYSIFHRMCT